MTAPYAARIAELITGDLRHEFTATVVPPAGDPFPLEVTAYTVTFSEDWAPYIQASITAVVPETAKLDLLDPRKPVRIKLSIGYTYPDNVTEIYPLADLGLRTREVLRPSDQLQITADSDEARAQDHLWSTDFPLLPQTGVNEAMSWLLEYTTQTTTYSLVSSFPNGYGAADLTDYAHSPGNSMWSLMDDLASRTNTRIYCDENRIWRIVPRPEIAGTAAHAVEVGINGTITDTTSRLSKEGWYNGVMLDYVWKDGAGAEHRVIGTAFASGPLSGGAVGYRVYTQKYDRAILQAQANNVAATKLRNLFSRGRSLDLSAIAAYWLRPTQTITVTLPTGEPEKHLIQSLSFRDNGLMDITTRQPIDTVITSGE